ncbi:MAG: hypothetical protein PHI12_05965 [Dehalococcoidales bacterium]|nr:hypothetical protein [Dehalococcoidales bacterium]
MTTPVRPKRGGFLRPFGCGWFIREFLLGNQPYGAPAIDPLIGAPQADIFYHYKTAIIRVTAADRATRQEEKQARREKRSINPDNIELLISKYLARIPYKGHGCRYHSFVSYFSTLRRLGWVEPSGKEETSAFQDNYPSGQPRRYYRLTPAGQSASDTAWANPHLTLYGRGHYSVKWKGAFYGQ